MSGLYLTRSHAMLGRPMLTALPLVLSLTATAEDALPCEEDAAAPCATPGWIELEVDADFDTALTRVQPEDADDGEQLADLLPTPKARLRGRWYARLRLVATGLDGVGWTMAGGVRLGHQWWRLQPGTFRPVGETSLDATAPFGARGHDLSLTSTVGAWAGPVGLLAGPSVRHDRLQWDDTGLPAAWTLGPQVRLAARLGPLTPWVAATPAWALDDARPPSQPWDELRVSGGLQLDGRPITLRLSGSWRDTAAGDLWSATVGLHLRLL